MKQGIGGRKNGSEAESSGREGEYGGRDKWRQVEARRRDSHIVDEVTASLGPDESSSCSALCSHVKPNLCT